MRRSWRAARKTLFGASMSVVSAAEGREPERFRGAQQRLRGHGERLLTSTCARTRCSYNQYDNVDSKSPATSCSVARSETLAPIRPSRSRSATVPMRCPPLPRPTPRSRRVLPIGRPPTARGWNSYVNGLRAAPASVSSDTLRRRAYFVAAMTLHAAEDKAYRGASVAGFATPWGDFRMETTLTTVTTGCGVVTFTSKPRA